MLFIAYHFGLVGHRMAMKYLLKWLTEVTSADETLQKLDQFRMHSLVLDVRSIKADICCKNKTD